MTGKRENKWLALAALAGALALIVVRCLVAAVAPSAGTLIAARAPQGICRAAVLPSTLSSVNSIFRARNVPPPLASGEPSCPVPQPLAPCSAGHSLPTWTGAGSSGATCLWAHWSFRHLEGGSGNNHGAQGTRNRCIPCAAQCTRLRLAGLHPDRGPNLGLAHSQERRGDRPGHLVSQCCFLTHPRLGGRISYLGISSRSLGYRSTAYSECSAS